MSTPEFDPVLVEQAARAMEKAMDCRRPPAVGAFLHPFYDYCVRHPRSVGVGAWDDGCPEARRLARDVLTAVAPTLRAEGAKVFTDALTYYAERQAMENPKGWRHVIRVVESSIKHGIYSAEVAAPALATLALLADADTAYQRGMVEGARQVLAAVDAFPFCRVSDCNCVEAAPLRAARGVVARIEGGA